MNSCLYHGQVRHTRYSPRHHGFRYRLFQCYLDLDELTEVLDSIWFCSSRRPAPVRFRRSDHLGPAEQPLKQAVLDKVRSLGGPALDGRVCLLTNLRYFGYGFNPVSFYFCHDRAGAPQAVLAEVNNTPWGEQHCYLVPFADQRELQQKAFHVSPFMGLDMQYRWAIGRPGERLTIHIENLRDGERLFDAALALTRAPLTATTLARMLARFPLMTLKVIGTIYFEALRLWLKGVPYHPHSKPEEAPIPANKQP